MAADRDGHTSSQAWLADHLKRRGLPLVAMTAFIVVSMAYSLWWEPVVDHGHSWIIPGDIWSTFRAAHWVGWGDLGGIYGTDTQLVTFPGIAVLLAPVAMMSGALGLSESIVPVLLPHPTSWLILGPAMLALGSSCVVAFDAVAEELAVGRGLRIALCWMEAAVIFQVVTIWGHPEDTLALALALYAMLAAFRNRWSLAGWLWGAAIVIQPLVLLMFPLAFSRTPRGQRLRVCAYGALPTVVLLAPPLLSSWSATSRVLFHQANFPHLDHATPWLALAPRLSSDSVGAGPGRMLAVLAAIGLGLLAYRRRPSVVGLLWLCALSLGLRCCFESVMVPFYLGPPLALMVVVAAARNRARWLVASFAVAMVAEEWASHRFPEWGYWTPMVILLAVGLACGWPGREALGLTARGRGDTRTDPSVCAGEQPGALPAQPSLEREPTR
ncbi:MAG TPA: hypothetical protein VFC03_03315 [Acidimicrobiales bacterium]|nr:hypothetical protein [Acidimicrobiales bacterium]